MPEMPNRPHRTAPPKRPPRVTTNPNVGDAITNGLTGYIDSVDDVNNPKYVSIVVNNEYPAYSGFPIPANIGLKVVEAPYPPSAPPSGTLYFNNRTHHNGGSQVTVDIKGRTFTPLTGFSTSAPVDYSAWFKDIHHGGGIDPTHGWQNPGLIDVTQVIGLPTSVSTSGPVFASGYSYPVTTSPFGSPSGVYDIKLTVGFTLTNPIYLYEVRFYAVAQSWNGSSWVSQGYNPATVGASPKHVAKPSTTGIYNVIIDGLNAGTPYDVYAVWVGLNAIESTGALRVTTTPANPLIVGRGYQAAGATGVNPNAAVSTVINSAPYIGSAPRAIGIGNSQCDIQIPFFTDVVGTLSNTWIAGVETVWALHSTTNWTGGSAILSPVAADGSSNGQYTSGANVGLWSGVSASTATAIAVDLGIRYIDFDGRKSNVYVLWSNYTVPNLKIGQSQYPTMPSGTTCSATLTRAIAATDYTGVGSSQFQLSLPPFNISISDTNWANWYGGYKLVAKLVTAGASLDGDTNPLNYLDLKTFSANTYTNPVGGTIPLGASSQAYQVGLQVIDQAGNPTLVAPFAITTPQQIDATQTIAGTGVANMIIDAAQRSGVSWNHSPLSGQNFACSTTGSPYWTYSTLDGTIAAVIQTGDNGTNAATACNAFVSRASSPRTTAANTKPMQVSANAPYIAGAYVDVSFAGGGSGGSATIQIIAASDIANYSNPTIYQQIVVGGGTAKGDQFTPVWTPTAATTVCVRLLFTNLGGYGVFSAPRFAQTSVKIPFALGAANPEQQDHTTQSLATQAVITTTAYGGNAGSVNPTALNPAYGNAPHGSMSAPTQGIIGGTTSGNATLTVGAPGGVIGVLPLPNHASQVTSTIASTAGTEGSYLATNTVTTRHLFDETLTRRKSLGGTTRSLTSGVRNLLFNPGFYNSGAGWTNTATAGATFTPQEQYQRYSFSGTNILTASGNPTVAQVLSASSTPGAVQNVTLSAYIEVASLTTGTLNALVRCNGASGFIGFICTALSITTSGYIEVPGAVPTGTTSMSVEFYYTGYTSGANSFAAYIYKPQLEYGTVATPFSDDQGTALTAFTHDLTGSLDVSRTQVGKIMPLIAHDPRVGAGLDVNGNVARIVPYTYHGTEFRSLVDQTTGRFRLDNLGTNYLGTLDYGAHHAGFRALVSSTPFGDGNYLNTNAILGRHITTGVVVRGHLDTTTGGAVDRSNSGLDSSGTVQRTVPLTYHDQTVRNRNGITYAVRGKSPYIDSSNVLRFPSLVLIFRPDGTYAYVNASTALTIPTNTSGKVFVPYSNASAGTPFVVSYLAAGVAGTGYAATNSSTAYEAIGTIDSNGTTSFFSPYFANGNTDAASYDVIGDDGSGNGNFHAGKARSGTNLPYLSHAIPFTTSIDSVAGGDGSYLKPVTVSTRHLLDNTVSRRKSLGGATNFTQGIRNLLFNPGYYNSGAGWDLAQPAGSVSGAEELYQRYRLYATNVTGYPIISQTLTPVIGPSQSVVMSGYMDVQTLTTGVVSVDVICYSGANGTGTYLGQACGATITATGYFEATGVVPAGTVSVLFRLYYSGWTSGSNAVAAYLYKPQLEYGTVATPFSDDGGTALTAFTHDINGNLDVSRPITGKILPISAHDARVALGLTTAGVIQTPVPFQYHDGMVKQRALLTLNNTTARTDGLIQVTGTSINAFTTTQFALPAQGANSTFKMQFAGSMSDTVTSYENIFLLCNVTSGTPSLGYIFERVDGSGHWGLYKYPNSTSAIGLPMTTQNTTTVDTARHTYRVTVTNYTSANVIISLYIDGVLATQGYDNRTYTVPSTGGIGFSANAPSSWLIDPETFLVTNGTEDLETQHPTVQGGSQRAMTAIDASNHVTQAAHNFKTAANTSGVTLPASSAVNALGSVAKSVTDAVLEYYAPSVSAGTSTTVSFWLDNGTTSGGPKFWQGDIVSPTSSNASITTSAQGNGASSGPLIGTPWFTVNTTGGAVIYVLVYYNVGTATWGYTTKINAQFLPYEQIAAIGDGICPFVYSVASGGNAITAGSGTGGGSGHTGIKPYL